MVEDEFDPYDSIQEYGTGHWCCGEPMEVGKVSGDGYDVFVCPICGREE